MSLFVKHAVAGLALLASFRSLPAASPKNLSPREYLPPTLSWLREVESVQMLAAILGGTPPASGGMGWFHPGQSVYGLKWLVERMDGDNDGIVSRQEFTGPAELFDRLDRDHDGRLTRADFDWSDDAPLNRQMRIIHSLFRHADADHNEKLTAAEWQAMFRHAAAGKDALTREELHALLFPPPLPKNPGAGMPSPWMLLKGMLDGEIGSLREGPAVGWLAPDFSLPNLDDDKPIALSSFRGKKPVVLVFGSFT